MLDLNGIHVCYILFLYLNTALIRGTQSDQQVSPSTLPAAASQWNLLEPKAVVGGVFAQTVCYIAGTPCLLSVQEGVLLFIVFDVQFVNSNFGPPLRLLSAHTVSSTFQDLPYGGESLHV